MKKWFKKIARGNGGFGLNELLGVAAAMILAAFIVIPGLTRFGKDVINRMEGWWRNVAEEIFLYDVDD